MIVKRTLYYNMQKQEVKQMKNMRKLVLPLLLALALLVGCGTPAVSTGTVAAVPTQQNLTLDGSAVTCASFNIGGNNYFRLRDLAELFNGTDASFSLVWDGTRSLILVETGQPYDDMGETKTDVAALTSADAAPVTQEIVIDGQSYADLSVYNIAGNNYFRLRDLQPLLRFGLSYDQESDTIALSSHDDSGAETLPLTFAESYGDVAEVLANLSQRRHDAGSMAMSADSSSSAQFSSAAAADIAVEAAEEEMSAPAEAAVTEYSSVGGGDDYSETNTQVSGIDEGDIVKTDGKYLYILRGENLIIARADGADTDTLSVTKVGDHEYEDYEEDAKGSYQSMWKEPNELYIRNGKAAVLSYYSMDKGWYDENDEWKWEDESYACVDIYDVSNPAAPQLVSALGQDGYNLASRLKDNTLYVVSSYYVYSFDENDPVSYIPRLYFNGTASMIDAGAICIAPNLESTSYALVCSYDLSSGTQTGVQTVLGGGSEVYMSHDSIYLANSRYVESRSEPRMESVYTVVDYSYDLQTELYRFGIADGLELKASGAVPGGLNNQFSMDEYSGALRLVTTTGGYSYTLYTDEAMDFRNTRWPEEQPDPTNGLYILDENLSLLGKVDNLAQGERIYSARFDGDTAYFCTFRNVDPLFAVDLSDPTSPTVLSALKISGFSQYLHFWSGSLLFGAGFEANEETGRTGAMKLVMFDTSDKTDVVDINTLLTDCRSSVALYNHKAFLIDSGKNLIAFPGDRSYYIFSYDEEDGFVQQAEIPLESWSWVTRGLYIGDMIYIVSQETIEVISLESFEKIASIPLPSQDDADEGVIIY